MPVVLFVDGIDKREERVVIDDPGNNLVAILRIVVVGCFEIHTGSRSDE